jgi:hypothetical protein
MPNGSALHPEFLANGRFFQVRPRQYVVVHFLGHPGGYSAGYLRRLSRRSSGYFGFWHRHSLGDGASFNFYPFQQMLTVKIRQPSHEFTFGVGMSFIPYPLVLTPVV